MNWNKINWKKANDELKALQAKLYGALKSGTNSCSIKQIHNEILTSFAARAIAVRRVCTNDGRKTHGVDGITWTRSEQKYDAIIALGIRWSTYKAKPVRRVWIPKSNGKTRPLGIPTIEDRAVQTLYNFILDVHHEHGANPRSFGFRIGKNAKQAIDYAWRLTSGAGKRWILKVDIRKAYDMVNHQWLIQNLPINKHVVNEWLKSGIIEVGGLVPTNEGVPQGSPISPTIFNIVMEGIEEEILNVKGAFPIRYADDIAVFANSREDLEKTKERIVNFLKPRGLELNEEKTVMTPIEEGFELLGYNIKEYPYRVEKKVKRMPIKRGTVIVKPSKTAVENFRQNLKTTYNRLSKSLVITLIKELNPKIRGWANYFNAGGGWTHIKNKLGHWIFHKNLKWVYKKHSRVKGQKRLLLQRYFKGVHRRPGYYNKWTLFGKDKGNNVAYITDIQEITVAHDSGMAFNPSPNPYKPEDYPKFDKKRKRQIKKDVRLNKLKHKLLVLQDGNCIKCGQLLDLNTEQVELDHIIPKVDGGENSMRNMALLHKECHLQKTNWERKWRSYERKRKLKEKDKEPVAKKHRASYACQQWQKKIETKSVE